MTGIRVGDIVARKSYGMDVYFRVVELKEDTKDKLAVLKGVSHRIIVDAPVNDLVLVPNDKLDYFRKKEDETIRSKHRMMDSELRGKSYRRNTAQGVREFKRPGRVLHFDGDEDYMNRCLEEYQKMGIEAHGRFVAEKEQPKYVYKYLQEVRPDILILTGHDSVKKGKENYGSIKNYTNSSAFVEAVHEARRYEPDMDGLVIFAGACQSMYNALLEAGANFASSPYRVLIHTLDPVLVAEKIALTEVGRILEPKAVVGNTITGTDGIGGVMTGGKCREGYPAEPFA